MKKNKRTHRKLTLNKSTLRRLSGRELRNALGGDQDTSGCPGTGSFVTCVPWCPPKINEEPRGD